jgi:phosphotransferase system HPr-like phosphotransfer protein
MPIAVNSKNGLIEIFETLSHFPNLMIKIKSGDYTVDAHSLMGVFAIDISKPFELILDSEPDDNFKTAVSEYTLKHA